MRKNHALGILSVVFTALTCCAQQPQAQTSTGRPVQQNYGRLPLLFEANQGQTDSQVKFLSQGKGYSVFLTSGSMVLSLRPAEVVSGPQTSASPVFRDKKNGRSAIRQMEAAARAQKSASTTLAFNLVGSSTNPQVVGEEPLRTKVNYFIGRDPKKWRTNVPTYGRVRYRNVYPGIDLVYYGNHRSMEYDFDLAPGADATQIQFEVKGADAVKVDSNGSLVLTKGSGELRFQPPILYQETNGVRARVPGTYVLHGSAHVGFEVGTYDTTKPLVIDPVLIYSTFLGGSNDDFSNGIAVDSAGDAYVVGLTDSPDFPLATLGSYGSTQFRMFLTKFDPTGSSLLFADYFGGTSGGDQAYGVALDSSGNAYITGAATSSDFPVTITTAVQPTLSGSQDAFLVELSADGSTLLYSTYLGGTNSQLGYSVSVDPAGEAVIAGITQSTDFPLHNPYQNSITTDQFGDWGLYGFVTKFATNGSLSYSTYLSGSTLNIGSCTGCFPDSEILGVATDSSGNAYVTGYTTTMDFPTTTGALTTTYPGYSLSDVGFVSKFDTSGSLVYSTYLAGQTSSFLNAIAVDSTGAAYVTGYDIANDSFPIVTTSICDPSSSACNGAVIAKLDPTGASLTYSTFLGMSNNMAGQAIQVDAGGDAFVVGSDIAFDLANPIEAYAGNGDVVVAEINPGATSLLMATFLGGQGWEAASGLALDGSGAVYVTGVTQSVDFPVTKGAYQVAPGGQNDAFVAKIDPTTSAPAVAMSPFSLQFGSQNVLSTSAPQTTVLRNMGSAALTISSKTTGIDFGETDDCGTSVPAASFCTFTVTFTPTAADPFTEALTIVDNAAGSPHIVTLSGTGIGPGPFTTSPSSLSFSASPVGSTTAAQTVTVTNASNATINISGAQASGDFAVATNNCSSVAANGSCTVQVSFSPTTAGTRTGTLRLTSSTGSSGAVSLTGSGIDFVASATNSSATVTAGGSATYQLSLGSIGGNFSNSVSFACTGAPAYATCAVTPQSVTPGTSSSTLTVTVQTAGTVAAMHTPYGTQDRFLAAWIFAPMGFLGVILLGRYDRRRKIVQHAGLAITIFAFLVLAGCSGTSTGTSRSKPPAQVTPAGTYTLTVVGTSGKAQHSVPLTLTVQ